MNDSLLVEILELTDLASICTLVLSISPLCHRTTTLETTQAWTMNTCA